MFITLSPVGELVSSNIGQHFFLQSGVMKSEHPFTVIRNTSGVLEFGMRRVGGFWGEIDNKNIGDTVLVDGPYGTFTREAWSTNKKVIISAGIGVTPFVDLVDRWGEGAIYI